ncbi:MAG: DUF6516 family protein [Gammaproteobacteria bacterium]|nr:DUF6516 family protein [Gammaproteobacteria bacterium]
MSKREPDRDPCLDELLDLHGQTIVIDDVGHWVKFKVNRVEVTPERPHGLDYSLTLHAPDGARLIGFDNAHPVRTRRSQQSKPGSAMDHRHRLRAIRLYEYKDSATLLADFWQSVDDILYERGAIV